LYNFACHPVLQELQNCYSADLFGMVASEMETRLGGKVICLPLNGPSGNVNPGPGGSSSEYNQEAADYDSQEIVQTVAAGIETALERGEAIECNLVRAGVKLVSIPLADPTVVERFPHLRFTRDSPNYALNTQVQVIRLGDVAVVGLPGEPMVSVGQRVKEMAIQVGFRTVIVAALANDFIGYYFLPESFDTGGPETILCAHRDEGTVILDGVEQILSKMRECED
ncbi:MAG TPA: hypothetical protein VKK79_25395, partial [Candidatus Lokiarchaeia archaeon]|nr:hypothetical protein [Candidatus Lokiarchaeia archaeon]